MNLVHPSFLAITKENLPSALPFLTNLTSTKFTAIAVKRASLLLQLLQKVAHRAHPPVPRSLTCKQAQRVS